jgi:hypothetical protein
MSEELVVLCALAIGLFVFTAIGHAIWVAGRTILRALLGMEKPAAATAPATSRCQRCETPLEPGRAQCLICEWPLPLEQQRASRSALRSLREKINHWSRAGVLDSQSHRQLVEVINAEVARLTPAPVVVEPIAPKAPAELPPIPLAPDPTPAPSPLASPQAPDETIQERLRRIEERRREPEVEVAVVAEVVDSGDSFYTPAVPPTPVKQAARVRVEPIAAPVPPRRSFSELFLSFMEERNIRWGELIGGLLIVCCSIALVISFWSAIAERPVLKFIVFNGVNAAIFGAAAYTERRWKLPNTSRGLFIIGGLLVPLNFLAMAAFSAATQTPLPLTLAGEAISVALFGALLWLAGRSIAPNFAWVLSGGVMLAALAELLVRHFIVSNAAPAPLLAVGALPVAAMLLTAGAVWRRWRTQVTYTAADTHELFRLTGLAAFAGLAAVGLLIARAGATATTMERLSPLIALYACGPLTIGRCFGNACARRNSPAVASSAPPWPWRR